MPKPRDGRRPTISERSVERPSADDWPWNLPDAAFLAELRRQSEIIAKDEEQQPDEVLQAFGAISAEP